MKRINLLNSIPIIVIACFLLSLIFIAGLLWPQYQDLKELQKNINEKRVELWQQEQYFLTLSQIKEELKEYEEEISKINSSLPDYSSLPSLFNFLQKASSQSGLVLIGISPFTVSPSDLSSDIKETQFSLQTTGPYSALKNFLSTIENSARLIEVENISFLSPKEGNLFTFNLRVKVRSY